MSEQISEPLLIMAVGMITVFAILGLVVLTGQALIRITNRFAPDISEKSSSRNTSFPVASQPSLDNTFDKKKLAAIVGTVETITGGRGRVKKIEKV